MVTMQWDCRCQRQTFSHIFFNLFPMFLSSVMGHLFTAHPIALHMPAFTPTKEPSYWTVMNAAPATRSPFLIVHVQTSSPAVLEHARHEVSHYISFPASSSSWHTLLQFKPQMSDVIVQWFQTHLSGLLQCLCSLSDLSSLISILHLANTLRHCFHLIFQWILSSVILNWPGFLSDVSKVFLKIKKKNLWISLWGTSSQPDWWKGFYSTSPVIADVCSLIHIPTGLSACRLSSLWAHWIFPYVAKFHLGAMVYKSLAFFSEDDKLLSCWWLYILSWATVFWPTFFLTPIDYEAPVVPQLVDRYQYLLCYSHPSETKF